MSDELVLSAWQLYTGLFILFWAAQIYFSSFWMTILCCLKFGLMAQLLTDYMYRRGRYDEIGDNNDKNQLNTLVGMARTEAELVPSLTAMAKEEAGMETRLYGCSPIQCLFCFL